MRFTIPPIINASGLVPFLAQLGLVADLEPEIVVNFSDVRRVSPAGLVALVAAIKRWQQSRPRRVKFEGLQQCPICGYLQRMDVFQTCGVELGESFARHPAHGRFVPVQTIVDVDAMSSDVAACIAPGGDHYAQPLSMVYDLAAYVLGELGANVRQHSRGSGYVTAQTSAHEGMVRLAVADNGTGVRQSFVDAGLRWSFEMSDTAALRRAIEPRTSSKGAPMNQGVGLTLVTGLARLARGWLLIASGTGLLQLNPDEAVHESIIDGGRGFQGTLVALTFRRDKLRDFSVLLHEAKQEAGLLVKRPIRGKFT